MNTYEKLQEQACEEGIDIIDYNFQSDRIKGLYCDGMVAISTKINTSIEKACVLAEEILSHRCWRYHQSERCGKPKTGTKRQAMGVQPADRSDRTGKDI